MVPPNTDVEISCRVPDGSEVKSQWFKDGKPIKVPSEKYEEKIEGTKRTLHVKGANTEDQGQFTCQTPMFKSSANLQVTSKRKFAKFFGILLWLTNSVKFSM